MPSALQKINTRAPKDFDKAETKLKTEKILEELDGLQNLLYANGKHNVLIILQGMDASGKDGVVKKVFGAVNPLGIKIQGFKAPAAEELAHDFLWRIHKHTPEKGMMQLFNRSHYEDVLITRVHKWCDDKTAEKRMKAINDFEQLLQEHNDTIILKFYLHISPEEQQERLKERMEMPEKSWKYNPKDFDEAKLWDEYMKMYAEVFEKCNAVPWHIVPADQNWYKEYIIAKKLRDTLAELDMQYPKLKS